MLLDLSIIIVNYRTVNFTTNCINSILQSIKEIKYEIILIDNAPIEDNEAFFTSLVPDMIYFKTLENLGFGRANNIGIEHARGKYILIINSDTIVMNNCIEKCYRFMEMPGNETIGLLGCKNLNADLSFQPSFYPFLQSTLWSFLLTDNPLLYKIFKIKEKYKEPTMPMEVGDVAGSFMFLRKEVIEKVNAFDPDFFLYFEESEWCKVRISKYYKIFYYPEAQIIHLGGKSTPQEYLFTQFRLSLSLFWYKKGWLNYCAYILYCYANIIFFFFAFLIGKDKKYFKKYVKTYIDLIPYIFYDIPRYSSAYGSRKSMLIFKKAKKYFA